MNNNNTLKTILIPFCILLSITVGLAQKSETVVGSFYSIRNKDFSQLINASTPGLDLAYNADKATINGSFTIDSTKRPLSKRPFWIQVVPSIGTTTTLYEIGQKAPQPDFSIAISYTLVVHNVYYYDKTFTSNYNSIKISNEVDTINTQSAGDPFRYTSTLHAKLQDPQPTLKYKKDSLYTAKRINWISIKPEWGGTAYAFFDAKNPYLNQIYKPYYQLWDLNMSFNHYWYVNNDDVHWDKPTTRFFFWTISVRYGTNNNTDILRKVIINDVTENIINPITKADREVISSTTAYNGTYKEFNAITPSFEILYSFVRIFALDVFGNYNLITSNNINNYGNIAGGLYFYTNSTSSKINIGIYYQRSVGTSTIKEIIGLKTKVPIKW